MDFGKTIFRALSLVVVCVAFVGRLASFQHLDEGIISNPCSGRCTSLSDQDLEVSLIINAEESRQRRSLGLIASENIASPAVREALGSVFTNKYSEGRPGLRYYGGTQYVDEIERLCEKRALSLYGLDPGEWGVNVQAYSGSIANLAVYVALLKPHDRIMGLHLPSGGHLTHGYYTSEEKISISSIFYEPLPYEVDPETGLIDYDGFLKRAEMFLPKLIVVGTSSYPRDFDYKRIREIADSVNALVFTDMAHTGGLVAAMEAEDPFKYSDVVVTTTCKSLRGPRGAMVFSRKRFSKMINKAIFPRIQGGPHNNQIAAIAVALKEASTFEFQRYAMQVKENAKALASALEEYGYKIVTGGTDNHMVLWDLRPTFICAHRLEIILENVSIDANRNTLHGDKSATEPGGIRLGTLGLTTRGFVEKDFGRVAEFLHRSVEIAKQIERTSAPKTFKEFKAVVKVNDEVKDLRKEVEKMADSAPPF